jgi:hypothetical protein
LGLFEDAVSLALDVDLELAKAVANTPEDDDGLRRKLWLSIAKHVVQGGSGAAAAADAGKGAVAAGAAAAAEAGPEQAERIKMAVEFLKEAGEVPAVAAAAAAYVDWRGVQLLACMRTCVCACVRVSFHCFRREQASL